MVILPSRITNLSPTCAAILSTNFTVITKESPGITALISSGKTIEPVTFAVRKKNWGV